MSVKPVPDGYHTLTPYLIVQDAEKLIAFAQAAFGATEDHRSLRPDGKIMHAQIRVGDSPIMIGEANENWKSMPSGLYFYHENVDELYARALAAGATSVMEPSNQFYGDRMGGVTDPCGNYWWLSTHIEDVTWEEMQRRQEEFSKKLET